MTAICSASSSVGASPVVPHGHEAGDAAVDLRLDEPVERGAVDVGAVGRERGDERGPGAFDAVRCHRAETMSARVERRQVLGPGERVRAGPRGAERSGALS